MEEVKLSTMPREELGKQAAKKYRKNGLIPVVFYSKDKPVQHRVVKQSELLKALNTESHAHVIFNLGLGDGTDTAMIQAIDQHPVTGVIRHVDFLGISMDKEIETDIDVKLVGVAPGVKEGGTLDQRVKKLTIKCLPKYIPQHYNIDISTLHIGDSLRIGDIHDENVAIIYPLSDKIAVTIQKV